MVFRMFFSFLICDPKSLFCNGCRLCMGYSLCKMADFQFSLISLICGVFFEPFFAQNNFNVLVEWFFASFWHLKFLTPTDHFAKAIAFARWPIFKLVSFLEYVVFFSNRFLHRTTLIFSQNGFSHVFGIFNF